MKNIIVILITVTIISSTATAADEIAIIIHRDNTQTISLEDVKNIYSDNINNWESGARIKIYNAPINTFTREVFSQKVLGLSVHQALATEANKKITNSLKNPTETMRERLIVSIVSRKRNAIGYVSKAIAESKPNIKILMLIGGAS